MRKERKVRAFFFVCLGLLCLAVSHYFLDASAVRGDIALTMPDGRVLPGRYHVRWGHFVSAKGLKEPGIGARFSTLTFAGAIEVPGRKPVTSPFAVGGQRFHGDTDVQSAVAGV